MSECYDHLGWQPLERCTHCDKERDEKFKRLALVVRYMCNEGMLRHDLECEAKNGRSKCHCFFQDLLELSGAVKTTKDVVL